MSDLQLILIGLGLLLVVAVIIYNWRQEKKLRQHISADFVVPQKDVLVDNLDVDTETLTDAITEDAPREAEAVAPASKAVQPDVQNDVSLTLPDTVTETQPDTSKVKDHPTQSTVTERAVQEAATPSAAVADTPTPTVLPDAVNPQIDLTAIISATKPINGKALEALLQSILKELGASTMQHGLDQHGVWQPIDELSNQNDVFEKVACSLQLADRNGPVSKPLINKFEYAMEAIGMEFEAKVAWQGEGDAAQRAIDLDRFCIEVDQLVSVHLLQGDTPIHGTKFKGMAEANDLKLRRGKFYAVDNELPDLVKFVLANADEQPFTPEWLRQNVVRGAVFQIEIPKVANCELTFSQMVVMAQKMAHSLGATIVDDNQRPLSNAQLDKIKQQLKVINTTMVERGIAPGSASSMRLFN